MSCKEPCAYKKLTRYIFLQKVARLACYTALSSSAFTCIWRSWLLDMKRCMDGCAEDTPGKIFREDVLDLYLDNSISTLRLKKLAEKAQRAGARGIEDVVSKAQSSKPHRALSRLAQQGSRWPPCYKTQVPGKSLHSLDEKVCPLQVLLPHEIMFQMAKFCDLSALFQKQREALAKRPDVVRLLNKHRLNPDETLVFGLWQDGTPYNSDRSHTLELWSLSMLALPEERIPICCWPKELQVKLKTANSFLEIFKWSFNCAYLGRMPNRRHNGDAWLAPGDHWRSKRQGEAIGFRAVLGEFRGDWSMLKSVLSLPGWNDGNGICWKCSCCKEDLSKVGLDAHWRTENFTQAEFVHRQRELGKPVSPFFHIPTVTVDTIKIDFLHTADLGCTSDYLGNIFYECTMFRVTGCTKHEGRCDIFFQREILPFYKAFDIDSRIPFLRPSMLKKEGKKTFKLRAKAAEARRLVPLLPSILAKYFKEDDPADQLVISAGMGLLEMYTCLSHTEWILLPHQCVYFFLLQ